MDKYHHEIFEDGSKEFENPGRQGRRRPAEAYFGLALGLGKRVLL